jgi:hypothetical protein
MNNGGIGLMVDLDDSIPRFRELKNLKNAKHKLISPPQSNKPLPINTGPINGGVPLKATIEAEKSAIAM